MIARIFIIIKLFFFLSWNELINKCADECITEKYHIDISSQPMKTSPRDNTDEYYIQVYFTDFDFVSVTYNGKVKRTAQAYCLSQKFEIQ